MSSLINTKRPPVFCPGCAHDRVVHALDKTFTDLSIPADQVVIVSDIGCSGLFDTFFNTHAFHGLHGRALTYAAGLKMADPKLHVIVTMGDGGLGIGGAHLLSAFRRNLDMTLLVLNNFNYGMTGGQFSSTTPMDAAVGSGFLNQLEKPFDVCEVAKSAGCGFTSRVSAYQKDLGEDLKSAINFHGFSMVDIWGVCPGRYTKNNTLTPKRIENDLKLLPPMRGINIENERSEYGDHYKSLASEVPPFVMKDAIPSEFSTDLDKRLEIMILGKAGQRIITAAEILSLSAMTAGLNATQKSDYPITVLRGHSVGEVIISKDPVKFTGIENPDVIFALGEEGVNRGKGVFPILSEKALVFKGRDVDIPENKGQMIEIDFQKHKIKSSDRALFALGVLSHHHPVFKTEMIKAAIAYKFKPVIRDKAFEMIDAALAVLR